MEKSKLAGLSFIVLGSGGSEFSRFGRGGGLSFLGLGFPNLVHAGGGVWERGVSEFPGSEVRSGTLLYKPCATPKGRCFAPFWSENGYECIYH